MRRQSLGLMLAHEIQDTYLKKMFQKKDIHKSKFIFDWALICQISEIYLRGNSKEGTNKAFNQEI